MRHYAKRFGVSQWRQVAEMAALWPRTGIGPLEYYRMGLFRPSVPWEEKLNTVSQATYWKLIQEINPPEIRRLANNKMASYAMLRSAGIPTPRIHGVIGPSGRDSDGDPLVGAGDLAALVEGRSLSTVCFKPLSAWSGAGVRKVRFDGAGGRAAILPDGPAVSLEDLCVHHLSDHGMFLIQDAVEQHPGVARFHPPSLNTLRVWMYQRGEGAWEMGPGNLRIGVGGSVVDNTSAGGIGAAVDNDTGRLTAAVLRGLDPDRGVYHEEYAVHPTTGETIEGAVLPMRGETRALCLRTCAVFPFFGLMGLDVGFGVDRPWVIEVEADPHVMIQNYVRRGIRRDLDDIVVRVRRRGS